MKDKNELNHLLKINFPIIMAPMFLVSNLEMMKAGIRAGIMSTFPSLNYRKDGELEKVLDELNAYCKLHSGSYGVNIIVQKSNPLSLKHTKICLEKQVPFFITSLGNPKDVIDGAHAYGGKVFCDVTNLVHAKKCVDVNCDGFIAVGQGAGGHAGPNPLQVLIPALKEIFPNTPIVAAGGITNGAGLLSVQVLGASGASIGTRFIASTEAGVNDNYKNAVVSSGMDDIVMTTKLSGTPCAVINNDAAKKMGYTQNWLEKWLSSNQQTKKWFKMLVQIRGMKKLEKSVLPNNYQSLWTAGKSSELVHDIISCEEIVNRIKQEHEKILKELSHLI
ncbi:NAD(P)H-dependent flavin oxidoreductase [Aurantibacillus circumpalustris]|uniref:NAD(P)H-dependent flavin oxidoreductase n=1 Tax=Aurantibacillus circumpalustris TaxID=3036359 RepID=UPI00295ABD1F|nr:nitronate monooxygenase [Aurantibacillus circumpalustris]